MMAECHGDADMLFTNDHYECRESFDSGDDDEQHDEDLYQGLYSASSDLDASMDTSEAGEQVQYSVNNNQSMDMSSLEALSTPSTLDCERLMQPACEEDIAANSPSVTHVISIFSNNHIKRQILARIDGIFEAVIDDLLHERKETCIELKSCRARNTDIGNAQNSRASTRTAVFTFPGKTPEEAWRFSSSFSCIEREVFARTDHFKATLFRILEVIHECISSGTIVTKRDLYYKDPALFGKQLVVDRLVDQVAQALEVPRFALNVIATAKGLIAGAAAIHRRDGSITNLQSDSEGLLVPTPDEVLCVEMKAVQWIVVVEKEATFQSVIASEEWKSMRWQGLVITGKGYPDMATRALLRLLTEPTARNGFQGPTCYAMMDFDPDGLAIFSTYKRGSAKLAKEGEVLTVPSLQWVGLRSHHIQDNEPTHLLALTRRDRHKARKILEAQNHVGEDGEAEWRGELQVMLVLNSKAELQILDAVSGGIGTLIKSTCAGLDMQAIQ